MAHRIIIVPGENDVLRALPEQLGDDFEVQVCETANDALWGVRSTAPDLVMADVDLPGMSGLDLAEILPNFNLPTRMLLCNRESDARTAQQAQSLGVYDYIDGSVSADTLKQKLYQALQPTQTTEPAPEAAPLATQAEPTLEAVPVQAPAEPAKPALAPEPTATTSPPPVPTPRTEAPKPARPAPAPARPAPSESAPPPARRPLRRSSLVLTADNQQLIHDRMGELQRDVGAQCIFLSNREGMVITEVGTTDTIPSMVLLPMLSTSFSAAGHISQVLRERDSSSLYMQEGSHFDLYCFDIAHQFMLVLIFDKASSATKIGTAWVYTKRAIRDMLDYLA